MQVNEVDVHGKSLIDGGSYKTYEDTSFLTGDSPATLDINTDLGRNARDGYIKNDGAGDITVTLSSNGTNFGDNITLKDGDVLDLAPFDIDSIKLTWVSNSAYRVLVL